MSSDHQLLICLRSLLGSLELASDSALSQDVTALCCYLENPVYRLAVFAPFNHGKSTLLNALLGAKTLPMDLIPTTGAGIIVRYGSALATEVVFAHGQTIMQPGIEILTQYAVLNQDGRMQEEVAEVRISYPHPWLQTGVELLDLPGTNDREAQNDLVRERLLSADLVLHVLDARKLMTLEERENLTHWLHHRGITRVIFVVNFLNLLTPAEKELVCDRSYDIANSFRANLPAGISNIYFVDALPALRARLKGNQAAAQETGLTVLETALQAIASQPNPKYKLPRISKIAARLLEQSTVRQQELQQVISQVQAESAQQVRVKQKAAQLIQQGFASTVSDVRGWLYLPNLLATDQVKLAISLTQNEFERWLAEFKLEAVEYQQKINKWITQGSDFFAHSQPQLFDWDFPPAPVNQLSKSTQSVADSRVDSSESSPHISHELKPELNKVLQSKVGTVVLGGASYILNKVAPKTPPNSQKINSSTKISSQDYADAAAAYLQQFSDRANAQLSKYEQLANKYITFMPPASSQASIQSHQLQLLNNLTTNLETELARLQQL